MRVAWLMVTTNVATIVFHPPSSILLRTPSTIHYPYLWMIRSIRISQFTFKMESNYLLTSSYRIAFKVQSFRNSSRNKNGPKIPQRTIQGTLLAYLHGGAFFPSLFFFKKQKERGKQNAVQQTNTFHKCTKPLPHIVGMVGASAPATGRWF